MAAMALTDPATVERFAVELRRDTTGDTPCRCPRCMAMPGHPASSGPAIRAEVTTGDGQWFEMPLALTPACPPDRAYLLSPRDEQESEEDWLKRCAAITGLEKP